MGLSRCRLLRCTTKATCQPSTAHGSTNSKLAFFMATGYRQHAVVRSHGSHHQHLVAHILHNSGQEVPADAVKVVQVLKHDGQRAVSSHKLFQHLLNEAFVRVVLLWQRL